MKVNLTKLSEEIHENAVDKVFWVEREGVDAVNQYLGKLMLVDTEVSELVDAYVKERGSDEIEKEFVDVAIRLLDLYAAMRLDGIVEREFQEVLEEKVNFNKTRPPKHNRLM